MPFINVAGLRRMATMNGTAIPPVLEERIQAVEGDADAILDLGVDVASELCAGLLGGRAHPACTSTRSTAPSPSAGSTPPCRSDTPPPRAPATGGEGLLP
jgi:hypothetical protein